MASYYKFLKREKLPDGSVIAYYKATKHAQGAWNENEQHMAPATGILTREIVNFHPHDRLRLARVSLDILGLIPLDDFTITTRYIRPGKTIELIEAVLNSGGRDSIIARAWRLCTGDTSSIAGLEDQVIDSHPDQLPSWEEMKGWPGGFIESIDLAATPNRRPGKGLVWVTTDFEMVEGESTDDIVRILGLVDTANGVVPRKGPNLSKMNWMFPNTDLQIHMYRLPQGKWLGIEAVQQYGEDGIGLTSAILHDLQGPFGRSEQILTIRPIIR
ncbi:thioesterase family protein [Psychrobacter sp.]|uniref:thioesterase family protein n=1 Tax=Psychrobacter sp. TaxID=56811 RepID=UPI0025D41D4B|nr:thioesterase family protein [Psychrobacter sp.]